MKIWKIPPKIKIYEALSTIADKRVKLRCQNPTKAKLPDRGEATVISSNCARKYTVRWNLSTLEIVSDDNGSRWQGYLGYPSIAILMLGRKLPYSRQIAHQLKGIDWNKLNKKFKRDYKKVEEYVLSHIDSNKISAVKVKEFVESVYKTIKDLKTKVLSNPLNI